MRKLGLFALTLFLSSCGSSPDPLFCESPADCVDNAPATFCDIDKAFPGTELKNECIVPPSATACNRVQECSNGLVCSDITEGAVGECVECTAADTDGCGTGEICNTTNNQCEAQPCVVGTDGDAICAAAAPTKPFCVEADTCGQCRPAMGDCDAMAANAQVCDTENFNCRGCEANLECNSLICDIDTTSCALEADILYVGAVEGGGTPIMGGECTLAMPCTTIVHALTKVADDRNTIVVAAGNYPLPLTINGETVSIIGQGVVTVNPDISGSGRALTVLSSAVVSLDNVNIIPDPNSDAGSDAVFVDNATLSITNAEISGARDIGVLAENGATLTISQSTVSSNDGGGLDIDGSSFTIVNNFIVLNGSNDATVPGVKITYTGSTQQFDFNTIAANTVNGAVDATNVDCSLGMPMTAIGNIIYDGSSLSALPDLDANINCTFEYSDIEGLAAVGTNLDTPPIFANTITGDYHLAAGSPLIGAAAGASPVPDLDVDGDPRPSATPDIGADQFTAKQEQSP